MFNLFSNIHKTLLSLLIIFVVAMAFSISKHSEAVSIQHENSSIIPTQSNSHLTTVAESISIFSAPEIPPKIQSYEIKKGDTLSQIFELNGISASVLQQILEADVEYLSLETLQLGKRVTFKYDRHKALDVLILQIDAARTVTLTRQDDNAIVA